ncbi:MAG TPA: GNVR domain-containing protein [Pyrinomonadaceae bacterium]|jgi:polysaccharide chain length determinant protein (PEP-CTERM system associated)|nr:GNVR domain-containing protein [Pyrinomonadaceae bacterium]
MSVDFRQRKPGEYVKILRRRKWLLILPAIAITTAVSWVVYRLPDVYESSTLIVVRPSTLPKTVVPTVTEDNLTRQLASIAQVVQSRSSLEPLVEKYDLYKTERLRGEPIEGVIEMMRRDVNVKVNTTRNDITNGFNISYRYRDARVAQAITSELASKYINVQNQNQQSSGLAAKTFIDNQVAQAREALSAVDKQMLDFKNSKLGTLPTEVQPMLNQLSGLREEQKALMTEIGRLQDQRASGSNQLAVLKKAYAVSIDEASETLTDPKTTMAWSQLVSRKAALQGELTSLKQQYKDIHPDVIAKQKEIEQVQEQMDQQIAEWKDKIKEKQDRLSKHPDLTAASVQSQIDMADKEIARQQKALIENQNQINALVDRINKVPGVDVELSALERDYQTKKAAYDELLEQQQKIGLNTDAITQQQGEGIEVIDAANLPSKPVAPKRIMLAMIGLGAGLGLGLMLVGIFEGPRLLTIQNSEDARHYTGLPVLLSVPELLTPQEARSFPRRRRLLLAAGVVATLVSIPMLALALKLTHIFELLMQSSGRS